MSHIHGLRWRGVVLTFIAASYWPLHILTVNLFGVVRPERVFGLITLIWVGGVVLVLILVRLGMDVEPAETTSFVAVALAMSGGPLLREFSLLAYIILLACPVLAGWVLMRFRGNLVVSALIWAVAVALASGPILTFYESWSERGGPSAVTDSGRPLLVDLAEKPDIFVVVLDGYPGAIAAEQDGLGPGHVDVASELRDRGFQVPTSSWSSYWSTTLSIPSLMEMNYPVVEAPWRGGETNQDLQQVIAGDSALVQSLKSNGYETYMVESGWSAASCGPAIDVCVPSPLLDEATYLVLRHTAAWTFLKENPGPYALGTLAAFEWLLDHGPELSVSNRPEFLFMHVVSPHPPLLLQSDCSIDLIYERTGAGFNLPGVSTETREQYLVEQMDCVDNLMLELADSVNADDVVMFVSDHGTDRRYQADPGNVGWDRATTVERLNNFLAVRLPNGCTIDDSVIVPNVFREVLDCLSPDVVEKLPERMWVNPMVELDGYTVQDLLDMGAPTG